MAKSNSIFKLQGTIAGLTFVSSRAYGDHVRAKRGTYKKAKVNTAFKQESKLLLSANVPAKIFKEAIQPYRQDLSSKMLWQRLVSLFRKQIKAYGSFDFGKMEQFEIDTDHRLERLLQVQPSIRSDSEKSILNVDIKYDNHPRFTKVKDINGYKFTVIAIFPDVAKKTANSVTHASNVILLRSTLKPFRTELEIPAEAKSYIVCLKIHACIGGVVSNTITTTALRVIGSGNV